MSSELLEKLEGKIDSTIETIELLRLQIEELEERNTILHTENAELKSKYTTWENNLSSMLQKLDILDPKVTKTVATEETASA